MFRGYNRIWPGGLVCGSSSVASDGAVWLAGWYSEGDLIGGYSVPRGFSWIGDYKLELDKFSKIEQDQKVLISTFASFLTAIAKISPHRFEIFSKVPKILSPKSRGNFVYQVCYSRYHVSFYLWRIGPVLKHCKVPKY